MLENETKPRISVLLCVFNAEKTLRRCLESIQTQTLTDWECIICNDCSSDNSQIIIDEFANKDSRFKCFTNDRNYGLTHSLNECIIRARAEIYARQDADDWSDNRRLEIQYNFVKEHPEYAVVGTNAYNVDDDGNLSEIQYIEELKAIDLVNKKGIYNHGTWMMRAGDIIEVGCYTDRPEVIRSQDYDMALKLYAKGKKMYNIQESLYYTFRGEEAIRRMRNWKRVKGLMWIRWNGYKANHFPLWTYVYVLKPLFAVLIPYKLKLKMFKKSKTT